MLTITLTNDRFSSNMTINENLFKSPTSNSAIKVVCKPALKIDEGQLMNNVCDYINSFINMQIQTDHVVFDSSVIADSGLNKVSDLTFQVYW